MKIKRAKKLIILSVLLLTITACGVFKPAVKQEYNKDGLTFSYFSDWKITEDKTTAEAVGDVRFISLEGPNDAVLLITRFPGDTDVTLESYVKLLQTGMQEETKTMTGGVGVFKMDDGNLTPVEAQIAGTGRRGLAREFNIKVLNFPVPHRAETFLVEAGNEKWFIVSQSSKEDWEKLKTGFQTIFDSLSLKTTATDGGGKVNTKAKQQ